MVDVMDVPFLDLRVVNARYADELKTAAARVIDAGWYVLGQELPHSKKNSPVTAAPRMQSAWAMGWMRWG